MAYTPTTWTNNLTITPTLMNKLQQAVEACSTITGGSGTSGYEAFDAIIDLYRENSNTFDVTLRKGDYTTVAGILQTDYKAPNILITLQDLNPIYDTNSSYQVWTSSNVFFEQISNPLKFSVKISTQKNQQRIFYFSWASNNTISVTNVIPYDRPNILIVNEINALNSTTLDKTFVEIYNALANETGVFVKIGQTTLSSCISTIRLMPVIGAAHDEMGNYRIYAQDIKSVEKAAISGSGSVAGLVGVPTIRTYSAASSSSLPSFMMTLSPAPVATQPSTSGSMLYTLE